METKEVKVLSINKLQVKSLADIENDTQFAR